jgi:hypothetical protein
MAPSGSRWWCDVCFVAVTVNYVPKRLRHTVCRKWMVRVWPKQTR